jgi:Heterokaryon incompatibility protein (HET)
LPKTIYDAAKITRKLGLQYLWVDALCIIQDLVEDWQRESANMGNIYSNAFITIQASGAKDT